MHEYGSLESLFVEGGHRNDTIKSSLVHFTEKIKQQAARLDPARHKGIEYLLPSPQSGMLSGPKGDGESSLAVPKSNNRGVLSSATKMLSGFKSRWTTKFWWAN